MLHSLGILSALTLCYMAHVTTTFRHHEDSFDDWPIWLKACKSIQKSELSP